MGRNGSSIIWKAISHSISIIKRGLTLRIRTSEIVPLGIDAWLGCANAHILPLEDRISNWLVSHNSPKCRWEEHYMDLTILEISKGPHDTGNLEKQLDQIHWGT